MSARSASVASRIWTGVIQPLSTYAAFSLGRNSSHGQKERSEPTAARQGLVPVRPCSLSGWPHFAQTIGLEIGTVTRLMIPNLMDARKEGQVSGRTPAPWG